VRAELQALRAIDPAQPATTLVVLPQLSSFAQFMSFQEHAEAMAEEVPEAARVQVLAFHPDASFGESEYDPADISMQSPLPMLHLLRDADVEAADVQWAAQHAPREPPGIQARNAAYLRGMGLEAAAAASRECISRPSSHVARDGAARNDAALDDAALDDAMLVTRWQDGTLPFEQWTHEAHLRVAWQLARAYAEPLPVMAAGIQAYNARHQGRTSVGFHSTLTRFWMESLIKRSPERYASFEVFTAAFPELLDPQFPLDFYDHKTLFSDNAKHGWVPPLEWSPNPGSCPCPSEE